MLKAFTARTFHFARAFQSRPFALLWTGQTVSRMGDFAFNTALAWQVLLLTHSGTAMGIVLIASSIPQLIFLLLGGVAADRLPRLLILLCSDAGRAVAVLIIALLCWLHLLQFWHLVSLALIFGIAQGFFFPTFQAIPAQLVEVEMLPSANALNSLSQQIGILLGPILGATFIAASGPTLAFAFDGLTFVISTVCILLTGLTLRTFSTTVEPTNQTEAASLHRRHNVLTDIREGLDYVMRSPWLWITILISSLGNIAIGGSIQVAFPLLVKDVYHATAWLLGILGLAEAVGSLLGTLLVGQFARLHHRGLLGYLGLILGSFGVTLLGLPLPHSSALFVVISGGLLLGIGFSIFGVIWVTVLQEIVPVEKQGRVFSIDALGSFGLLPVGYALLGIATDAFGPSQVFLIGGILNILLSLLGLCIRSIREIN